MMLFPVFNKVFLVAVAAITTLSVSSIHQEVSALKLKLLKHQHRLTDEEISIRSKIKNEGISEYYVDFVIRMMEAPTYDDYIEALLMVRYAQSAELSDDDISLVEAIMRGSVTNLRSSVGYVTTYNTVISSHVFIKCLRDLESAMAIEEVEDRGLALKLSDISQAWKQLKGDEPQAHKSWAQLIEVAAKAESERKAKEEKKWVNRVRRSVNAAASRVASQAAIIIGTKTINK